MSKLHEIDKADLAAPPAAVCLRTSPITARFRPRAQANGRRCDLKVVLYHHLTELPSEWEAGLHVATAPSLFEAHVDRLAKDYDVVDLDAVISGRLPRKALLITFDDGYRSVRDRALPALARRGLPSVFFVSAAFLEPDSVPLDNLLCRIAASHGTPALARVVGVSGKATSIEEIVVHAARLPDPARRRLTTEIVERFEVDVRRERALSNIFLDKSELPLLAQFGCEVANHTRSHVRTATLADPTAVVYEVTDHQRDLQRACGRQVRAFSYPYGSRSDATPMVESMLVESGHMASFLVESRSNRFRRPATPYNRVSLHNESPRGLRIVLDVLPPLRTIRDLVRRPA